ncbi:poly(A)-specific ribonuclease PNLDC1 isoform X1 [Rousettus aegyptiacus]|uniref:poly(A)-specific ribonuclease PNLDC1 isoform X1 n=2 Tax=Rousettus aegyptiacus TaxID=9407 RepID=UPI00168D8342|nr:poly(A)-specific ribonuclease PNLDC1 isoform X1 [Rousettus aegyptiacus]
MDVGADEFEQNLPLLQELVLGADFVGLDIEFTGLRSNLSHPEQISLFDLPSEWYLKTRQSIQQFTICQIGLSVFSSIEGESNKYVAHSYNFFLFPTTFGILDSEFSFQASSVQFLNQYGFDYNKFLKNGIPYMNEEQEKKIKQNILTGNWKVRSSLDKDQIKVVIHEVTRWLDLAEEGDWMTLPGITGFQAFEVQLVLRQALPDIWTVLRDEGVIVKKVSREHRWYLENTSCDRESCWKEKILLSARGFSVFFQMLVKAQKPLVGHNMMMDLLHLHEKFFRPLPESYDQFKLNIHNLFPVLIDTKNVTKDIWKVTDETLGELNFPRVSNLSEVYEVLNSDSNPTKNSGPEIIHASKCEKYVETKYPHEAAYDAFLCGSVLLKVAHLLLWRVHGAGSVPEPCFPLYLDALAPYVNQVNLIRAGVPKIVSRLHFAFSPCSEAALVLRGVLGREGSNNGQNQGPTKLVIFFSGVSPSRVIPSSSSPSPKRGLSCRRAQDFQTGRRSSVGTEETPFCPSARLLELFRSGSPQYPTPHPHPQCQEVARGHRAAGLPQVPEPLQVRRPAAHAEPVPAPDQQVQGRSERPEGVQAPPHPAGLPVSLLEALAGHQLRATSLRHRHHLGPCRVSPGTTKPLTRRGPAALPLPSPRLSGQPSWGFLRLARLTGGSVWSSRGRLFTFEWEIL